MGKRFMNGKENILSEHCFILYLRKEKILITEGERMCKFCFDTMQFHLTYNTYTELSKQNIMWIQNE